MRDTICKNKLLLLIYGLACVTVSLSLSYKIGIVNQKLIYQYNGNCYKEYSVSRQIIGDSIYKDAILSTNRISNESSIITQIYKKHGNRWYYQTQEGEFFEWMCRESFEKNDTITLFSGKFTSGFFVPKREIIFKDKPVLIYDYYSIDDQFLISKSYYFDPDIGVVRIEDPLETKGCNILELKSILSE